MGFILETLFIAQCPTFNLFKSNLERLILVEVGSNENSRHWKVQGLKFRRNLQILWFKIDEAHKKRMILFSLTSFLLLHILAGLNEWYTAYFSSNKF